MAQRWKIDVQIIEEGDIYFFYKPKKNIEHPHRIEDVTRFYFVLQPSGKIPARYIVMGNKKMPQFEDGDRTVWGFVQIVGGRGFQAAGDVPRPPKKDASRPVGEGIYAIVLHRNHSHLMYSLELPENLGAVQSAFNIGRSANYIFLERPVEQPPKGPEIPYSNFSSLRDVSHINRRGTEILLVGVGADIGRIGVKAEVEEETLATADIISHLKVSPSRHPLSSLISGNWI